MRLRPPRQEAAAARRRESETKVQDLSLVLKKKPAAEKPKLPTGKYRALFPLNVYSDKSTTSKYEGEEGEGRLFTVTGVDVDEDGKVWVQTMRGWIKHDPKKMEKHVYVVKLPLLAALLLAQAPERVLGRGSRE